MIQKRGNKVNTYGKSLIFIRTILNDAKKYSIITNNVFEKFEIKQEPGKRHFLLIEKAISLIDFSIASPEVHVFNVLSKQNTNDNLKIILKEHLLISIWKQHFIAQDTHLQRIAYD